MSNKNSHKPEPKEVNYLKIRGRGNAKSYPPTNKCAECRFCVIINGLRICHGGNKPSFIPFNVTGCLTGEKRITYAKFKV